MKKTKKILISTVLFFATISIFAQNSGDSEPVEEISLPEVSTIISGGAPKVGKSAVPDYSQVLPQSNKNEEVLPQLPNSGDVASQSIEPVVGAETVKKNIYVEGLAGAGYPGYITGDFSLYRQSGKNPFKINFAHETANGYSGRSLTSGYFDRNTSIYADKLFSFEKMDLQLVASYQNNANGLQGKCFNISDVSQDKFFAHVDWNVRFGQEISLKTTVNGDWYKRYATVTRNIPKVENLDEFNQLKENLEIADYASSVGVIGFNPRIDFTWKNSRNFYATVFSEYQSEYDTKDSFDDHRTLNRGNFGVDLGWSNDSAKIYGTASAVIGDEIGGNVIIVPFTVGADLNFKNPLSSRRILVSAKGGIDSSLQKVDYLEQKFKFSALQTMATETSDCFGQLDIGLPVKDFLTFGLNSEFRTTVYNNGVWQPVYDTEEEDVLFGQYVFEQEYLTQFNSDFEVGFKYKILNLNIGWKNHWIDVPGIEDRAKIIFGISLQNKTSRYGFEGKLSQPVVSDNDKCPIVDFNAFFRVTNAVRLAASTTDVVKLLCGSERDYAGQYISRSGTASVLVKFFF